MKIALIGFGALGRYIQTLLLDLPSAGEKAFLYFDDTLHAQGHPAARPFGDYAAPAHADHDFYVCLGYKHLETKRGILSRLIDLGRRVPHYVHPTAYVHPSVAIGQGAFVYPGCSIDQNTRIGNGVWIANGDVVAHDCEIGDCCWFGASVTLSGKVSVGADTFIGSGTTVANDVRVGASVIVGLASAITRDIADGASVIGNPMRVLDRKLRLV